MSFDDLARLKDLNKLSDQFLLKIDNKVERYNSKILSVLIHRMLFKS